MNEFKKEFEVRRIIFGLSSIIKTPVQSLPEIVNQKLSDIMFQLTLLANKMQAERLDVLKDNEEHVKKGGKEDFTDSDDEAVGNEKQGMEDDGFEDEENSDKDWNE